MFSLLTKQGVVPTSEGVIPTSEGYILTKQANLRPYFARMRTLNLENRRFSSMRPPFWRLLRHFRHSALTQTIYSPAEGCFGASGSWTFGPESRVGAPSHDLYSCFSNLPCHIQMINCHFHNQPPTRHPLILKSLNPILSPLLLTKNGVQGGNFESYGL